MNIAKPAASYFTLSDSRRYMLALLLSSVLLFLSSANATPIETQTDIGCTYDDNVSRTMPANQLHDFSCGLNLKRPAIIPLAEHARVLANGYLGAELFNRYSGLSRVYGAAQAELQYRSSSEFGTPLYALFARLTAEQFQSGSRDGYRYALGLSASAELTDRISWFGALSHNERNGSNAVFDNKDNAVRVNVDYTPGWYKGTVYLGGEYRKGDMVISAPQIWNSWNPSNAWTLDDAFSGASVYSYRFDGSATLMTLGYNQPVGSRSSIDISWRRIDASVRYSNGSVWTDATYTTNQYSAAFLTRF